jgi:NAD-dependent SIR2 family protein deacetylase
MSKRKLKYGDLPKEPAPGVCLRCPECENEFSATRSDYWDREHGLTPTCATCDAALALVRRKVQWVTVSPEEVETER